MYRIINKHMGNVSVSSSDDNINPVCKCCDDFVKYVLNGCKSECGLSKCCICKTEAIHYSIKEEIEETEVKKNNLTND